MLDIICHYGVFYPLHAGCSDDRTGIRRDASSAQCSDLGRRCRRSSGAIDLWSTQCWSRDPRGPWARGRASAAPRPPRSARSSWSRKLTLLRESCRSPSPPQVAASRRSSHSWHLFLHSGSLAETEKGATPLDRPSVWCWLNHESCMRESPQGNRQSVSRFGDTPEEPSRPCSKTAVLQAHQEPTNFRHV